MKKIDFEDLADKAVQDIIDSRSVDITVENISAEISKDEFQATGYDLTCEDAISVMDFLQPAFTNPGVCERSEVVDAIPASEYETLKISDNRRGEEARELQGAMLTRGRLTQEQSEAKVETLVQEDNTKEVQVKTLNVVDIKWKGLFTYTTEEIPHIGHTLSYKDRCYRVINIDHVLNTELGGGSLKHINVQVLTL